MNKLRAQALTGGIVWGATLFLTTLASVYFGYGTAFLKVWQSIYPGFTISLVGSVVGAVYGFFDMCVGIYIIAWVYRLVSKH